jgi:hypothetical protein
MAKSKVCSIHDPDNFRDRISGPTIVGHIPTSGPPPIPVLICSNCGESHSSGQSLANCACYNEYYDACLG